MQRPGYHETVRDFLQYLEIERRYSPRTIEAYRSDLLSADEDVEPVRERAPSFDRFLIEAIGVDRPSIADVTQQEVRGFVAALHRATLSRRSIARKLAAVKSLFRFCTSRSIVETNPSRLVQTPKLERRLPTMLSVDETSRMMDLPDTSTTSGCRDALVLEMLYSTGIRRAELAGIRMGDIDSRGRTVRVRGKGDKERIVPYGTSAAAALKRYRSSRSDIATGESGDSLLLSDRGRPLDGSGIYRIVRRYMSSVSDQKKRSPHVLRHSFATHMLDSGAGLREVGEMLGHASLSSTQVYTHVTIERLKDVYDRAHPRADKAGGPAKPKRR
ncbi:MAG: tyrosine-type recombinase/integrase [bacterium]|nr:tyrosine-type recombinase/integrase [Candidatus Kapabacteria bacterium]